MDNEQIKKINPEVPQEKTLTRNENQQRLKTLRTYQGDMQEYISKNNTSIATIAVAEQKKKEKLNIQEDVQKYEIKNKLLVTFSISFLVIGLVAIVAVYLTQTMKDNDVVPLETSIISYSEKKTIVAQNKQFIISEIESLVDTWSSPANSIINIELTDNTESVSKSKIENIISYIGPNIPQNMARSLTEDYMFGIYSFGQNAPFIILKTKDYGVSYSGMLKWEENILNDLYFMFKIPGDISTYKFEDESFKNKDLRVVKSQERKTVFLYTFLDRETILITSTEDVFSALLDKYINSQITR